MFNLPKCHLEVSIFLALRLSCTVTTVHPLQMKTRASRWRAIAYPHASAIAYLHAHQNSECVPPVLIHWAIICDSFKVLAKKKPKRSWVTIKKSDPKSYILTSNDPRHAPGANFLSHCILLFITFSFICKVTMFVQNEFWTLRGHTPLAPTPGVTSKF